MTSEQLRRALSLIDDKYIDESMTEYKPRMPVWAKRSIATAAMLVLVVAVSLAGLWASGGSVSKNDAFSPFPEDGSQNPDAPSPIPPSWGDNDVGFPGNGGPSYGDIGDTYYSRLTVGDTVSTENIRFTVSSKDARGVELTVSDYDYTDIGIILVYTNNDFERCSAAFGIENTSQFKDTTELLELFTNIDGKSGTLRLSIPEGEIKDGSAVSVFVYAGGVSYRVYPAE